MKFYIFGMDAQAPDACARRLMEYGYSAVVSGLTKAAAIEAALDLSNMDAEWTYSEDADAWTLSQVVSIIQMWVIRRQTQAKQKPAFEVIDPPQTRQMRRHG